jgi:hypothetical protein
MSAGQVKLKQRDPAIMDDMLENYLEIARMVSEDSVPPENEMSITKVIKGRQDIILALR